ncbi:hypothetical protein H2200_001550 [Cladophialophora chaetospira]|uniref:Aldehyde dehydrogenase domain-containing protein n=1 Tax=Cladophialophora chaetospira TaxID=386627 RepID=A0AA39CPQ9_9EURO|nr:hypothetical protein H2200_001550 [Cladophialophora chaetospira]
MNSSITAGVLSAIADRRTRDLRFRQRQLISLHDWITNNTSGLETALSEDDDISQAEAHFVIGLALDELRRNYESLDLKKELDIEFRIKNARDNEHRRLPQEIVYVIPHRFTFFFGVTSALCASVAAGSCCIVELPENLQRSSALIQCMFSSLDKVAFTTTTTRPKDDFLKRCLVVDQLNCISPGTFRSLLSSQSTSHAIAIVDRTANVAVAAQALAASTLLFSGKGPYAPSCILVNEYVEAEFSRTFTDHASETAQSQTLLNGANGYTNTQKQEGVNGSVHKPLISSKENPFTRLNNREDLGAVIARKTGGPILLAVSSLDDAIDVANSELTPRTRALYVFGDPKAAKYLAQFVQTDVSFVNHIPAGLLVGPPAPSGYPVSPTARYRREMMETPSPQFVKRNPVIPSVEKLVESGTAIPAALLAASSRALRPTGQPREGDMNFFAQGLRASFVLYIYLPMTVAAAAIAGYGGRYAYRHWL